MSNWNEAILSIWRLEDRIKRLERAVFDDPDAKPSYTHDGRVVVDAKQVERWERIERAALRVKDFSEPFTNVDGPLPTANDLCWIHCEIVAANVGND